MSANINNLRNHCAEQLHRIVNNWLKESTAETSPAVPYRDCLLSMKLNRRASLRISQDFLIVYNCAIAYRLTHALGRSPESIAIALFQQSQKILNSPTPLEQGQPPQPNWLNLARLCLGSQGWLEYQIPWSSLEIWLDRIYLELPTWLTNPRRLVALHGPDVTDLKRLDDSQYIHARCCSLLRQVSQAQIIQLGASQRPYLRIISPAPIPWAALRTQHSFQTAEHDLLFEVISILDKIDIWYTGLAGEQQQYLFSSIQSLSDKFEQFDKACRIWEQTPKGGRELIQARSGLISLTQNCLHALMQEGFGLIPPNYL